MSATVWIAGFVLAATHLFAGRLRGLQQLPRSRWLSAAGGVSVAYVFAHLLPELAGHQAELSAEGGAAGAFIFLVAGAGLVVFYGLERLAVRHAGRSADDPDAPLGVFWLHVGSFALYNGVIGYLLPDRLDGDPGELAAYTTAMALHFLVNDHALRSHHRHLYDRWGRWILTAAIVVGLGIGGAITLPEPVLAYVTAALGGAVILNVLKEELPEERDSRFAAFAAAAVAYAAGLRLFV